MKVNHTRLTIGGEKVLDKRQIGYYIKWEQFGDWPEFDKTDYWMPCFLEYSVDNSRNGRYIYKRSIPNTLIRNLTCDVVYL